MTWQDAKSSNVAQIRWEPGNVTAHEHGQLMQAESLGRAIRALGQDKRHPYHKEKRRK